MKSFMEDTFGEPPNHRNSEEKHSLSSTQKNFHSRSNFLNMKSLNSTYKSNKSQSFGPDIVLKGTSVSNAKPVIPKAKHPECFYTKKPK